MSSINDETTGNLEKMETTLSPADKYFIEQRDLIIQDINNKMDSILNNLNTLNISLENSIAVGKEFESVSDLWKTFYDGLDRDLEEPVGSQDDNQEDAPSQN